MSPVRLWRRHRGRGHAQQTSAIAVLLFPGAGTFLGRFATDLLDMPLRPLLLMFALAALQIIGDAAVNGLVPHLEVVLLSVVSLAHQQGTPSVNVMGAALTGIKGSPINWGANCNSRPATAPPDAGH